MLPGAMTLYRTWRAAMGATWTGYCSLLAALGFLSAESSDAFEHAGGRGQREREDCEHETIGGPSRLHLSSVPSGSSPIAWRRFRYASAIVYCAPA